MPDVTPRLLLELLDEEEELLLEAELALEDAVDDWLLDEELDDATEELLLEDTLLLALEAALDEEALLPE